MIDLQTKQLQAHNSQLCVTEQVKLHSFTFMLEASVFDCYLIVDESIDDM